MGKEMKPLRSTPKDTADHHGCAICTNCGAQDVVKAELYEALREIMQNYAGQRWSIASVERGFAALAKARGEK